MKSDSILAKGVKLLYLPTVANPPYKEGLNGVVAFTVNG